MEYAAPHVCTEYEKNGWMSRLSRRYCEVQADGKERCAPNDCDIIEGLVNVESNNFRLANGQCS